MDLSEPTQFAPAERSTPEELDQQAHWLDALPLDLLNAVPNFCMVLNDNRQIVFGNTALLQALKIADAEPIKGLRPGEVLNCVHSDKVAGCGTTEFCRTCGAARAILSSLGGKRAIEECRIVQANGDALDLRVSGTPYALNGQRFSVFVLEDISHEKRRRVLERLFFHDLLNLSGVLMGYSELLLGEPDNSPRAEKMKTMLYQATQRLIDEVKNQRELSAAESGDLETRPIAIDSKQLLASSQMFYQVHEVAQGRMIVIDPDCEAVIFMMDRPLIERVLGNLIKNALEATEPGGVVMLGCYTSADEIAFTVHNDGMIPRDVQLQLFQRSFSTKGQGRGIGSYCVKLFTERYLGGQVSFTSTKAEGTTFTVVYPLELA